MATSSSPIVVSIIMGSSSDLPVMQAAKDALTSFGVQHSIRVVSAHRAPAAMLTYAQQAHEAGIKVIIAGAGGAAHLPGMVAAAGLVPVIGVPINANTGLQGVDALLSVVQMPAGVPVATVGINAAYNAGLLAVQLLAIADADLSKRMRDYKQELIDKVEKQNQNLTKQ